jgi:multidrug/hemolysin transport system permease protein
MHSTGLVDGINSIEGIPEAIKTTILDGTPWLVSSWIMASILTVTTITVPLGAVGNLIDDKASGALNDFYTSPISRNILALSYLISAWIIGFMMVMVNFVIGIGFVLLQGGELFSFNEFIQLLGLIILSIMAFSSFFFYVSLHIKTRNAYGNLTTLVSTFIGFLGGIYIPIGALSKNIQTIINILPISHAVTLIRRVYMSGAMEKVFSAPETKAFGEFYKDFYGLNVTVATFEFTSFHMLLSLFIFMLVFYCLSIFKLSKSKL